MARLAMWRLVVEDLLGAMEAAVVARVEQRGLNGVAGWHDRTSGQAGSPFSDCGDQRALCGCQNFSGIPDTTACLLITARLDAADCLDCGL